MSKETDNINILLEKIEDIAKQMKNFEDYYKNEYSKVFDKLKYNENEINATNSEINNLKDIIEKNKEYLLLELETSTDKNKQFKIENEQNYSDLIVFLKNDETNKILSLGEDIGRYKHELSKNKEYIKNITNKNDDLSDILVERENQITSLTEEITNITTTKDTEINKITEEKNNEINNLKNTINQPTSQQQKTQK